MHWGTKYISKKWVLGARGPDEFDCWGLLICIYRERYGLELPDLGGIEWRTAAESTNAEIGKPFGWEPVEIPFDGCAVGLGTNKFFHHVGIYLDTDGGLILHAVNKRNTIAQSVTGLRQSGFRRIQYFKHHAANYLHKQPV